MKKLTTKEFIEKAKLVHGEKYYYSNVEYINNKTKIIIICPIHGDFKQQPSNHITNEQGCPTCSQEWLKKFNMSQRSDTLSFIEKAKINHGKKYNYSLVNYINKNTKVKIICSKHGIFEQRPKHNLVKCGCPKCHNSKNEILIENILKNNDIIYENQKTFIDCKLINLLPFDFYLPDYNICIEYDGEQHFKPINIFGGEKRFKKQVLTDNIKNNYCQKNKIKL
jgi:hypothetical protein